MSDLTTPEGCESSVPAQPIGMARSPGLARAPVLGRLATVYGFWVAAALLYWPSAVALNALWTEPTQQEPLTHGYLVLAISLWLIFRDRKRLAAAPIQPVPRALIALALLSTLWVWAWRAEIQEAHVMLLPLLLFAAIVSTLGWGVARVLAFPIGYLYFAMPAWTDINGIVQTLSAKMTGVLIWITGLPAYVQGDFVHLPGGTIEIAQTCSGLHALIVGLALATLYGEITGDPPRRRLKWIGVMGVLSLIENWLRIFIVLTAAYFSQMHSSLVKNHYWLGWWLFAAIFAGFLWWAGRGPAPKREARPRQTPAREATTSDRGPSFIQMAVTLAVMALLPGLAYGMDWVHSGVHPAVHIEWPAAPAGWSGPEPVDGGGWRPQFFRPAGESLAKYTDENGRAIEVFEVAYRIQTQNAKLLSYWNHLLGNRPRLRPESVRIVNSASGRWRQTQVVNRSGLKSLIWSRYRVGNRLFVDPRLSQVWYGLDALALRQPLTSLTALRANCTPDCKVARVRLNTAAAELRPTLQ